MKNIAFIMQIDWNLIKQRPHFFAEYLSKDYKLDLFYIKALRRGANLVKNEKPKNVNKFLGFIRLPLSHKYKLIKCVQNVINKSITNKIYKTHYDYIYIPSPRMLDFIDIDRLKYNKLIYDCMDDILEFPNFKNQYKNLKNNELKILQKSDILIATSGNLAKVLKERGYNKEIYIINNGCRIQKNELANRAKSHQFNIMYFGMISQWFDFESVFKVLQKFDDIKFTIIGPSEVEKINHPRIKYIAPLSHKDLYEKAQSADAFIMPFKVNPLILSVDPIKVYEYISFLKPSFIVKYNETQKFNEFVELYETDQELIEKINKVKENYYTLDKTKVEKFLQNNSWEARVKNFIEIIERI